MNRIDIRLAVLAKEIAKASVPDSRIATRAAGLLPDVLGERLLTFEMVDWYVDNCGNVGDEQDWPSGTDVAEMEHEASRWRPLDSVDDLCVGLEFRTTSGWTGTVLAINWAESTVTFLLAGRPQERDLYWGLGGYWQIRN